MNGMVSGLDSSQTFSHIANMAKEEKAVPGAEAPQTEPLPRVANTPATTSHADATSQITPADLAASLEKMTLELFDTKLSFNYDERIQQVVVRVVNNGTEEVIRQLPPEHLIDLLAKFKQDLRGLLLNQQG